jgi:hypothetical protein
MRLIYLGGFAREAADYAVLGIRLFARGKVCSGSVESCPISKRDSDG